MAVILNKMLSLWKAYWKATERLSRMKSNSTFLVIFMLLPFTVSSGWATTIHVPDEYTTIQDGIDASADGDTVLVADGTYTGLGNKDIDFGGMPITVMSENGPDWTTIDCKNIGRGFYFHSGEDSLSRLEGFTIQNGKENVGGGIYCENSSPAITNCTITGNATKRDGGGIFCSFPPPSDPASSERLD